MIVYVRMPVELGKNLVVPRDAVMDTGDRKVVFLQDKEGKIVPVEVVVGFEADQGWVVKSGLKKDDNVVVNGNFLLDSESRLKAVVDGMGDQSQGGASRASGQVIGGGTQVA